jgi:DNA-binding response OmpR family regulator
MTAENVSPAPELVRSSPQSEVNPPARILVVDDDVDIRRVNMELLLDAGYEVDAAEDGVAAWDELQSNCYDLLVTEQHMRKLSGVGLLKKLHVAGLAIPVILVAGEPPTAELARHPWLQIEAMLLKPYAADELLAVVSNVLRAIDSAAVQLAPPPGLVGVSVSNRLSF